MTFKAAVYMCVCCICRKGCSRLFEVFAHIECVGDAEPVISQLYPVSTSDQVPVTFFFLVDTQNSDRVENENWCILSVF